MRKTILFLAALTIATAAFAADLPTDDELQFECQTLRLDSIFHPSGNIRLAVAEIAVVVSRL